MFEPIQKSVADLEDYILKQSKDQHGGPLMLVANLSAECGEVSDAVKRIQGVGTQKRKNDEIKKELAKEIVDVFFNALRIARMYDINMDDYFLERLEKIKRKFSTLEKPKIIEVDKNREVLRQYRELQFGASYNRPLTNEYKEYDKLVGKLPKGGNLLDHSCGEGTLKLFFEEKGWDSYGCDWSWHALSQSADVSPKNLVFAPIEHLPYTDGFFDVVISRRTLHTNPKDIRIEAIKEADRVLKKGGSFICSVQSVDDKETLKKYKKSGIELDYDPNSYVVDVIISGKRSQRIKHFYTEKDIKDEIESNSSLKVEKFSKVTSRAGWCSDNQNYIVLKAVKK